MNQQDLDANSVDNSDDPSVNSDSDSDSDSDMEPEPLNPGGPREREIRQPTFIASQVCVDIEIQYHSL